MNAEVLNGNGEILMSKHEVALLACKILAVYFIAESIVMAGQMAFVVIPVLLTPSPVADASLGGFHIRLAVTSLFPPVVHLLVGIVLWRISPSLARRIAGDNADRTLNGTEDFNP